MIPAKNRKIIHCPALVWLPIAIAIIVMAVVPLSGKAHASGREVVGYYPAWIIDELPASDVRYDVFTRIVYAFAWPDSNASISSYNPPAYRDLIDAAHRAGRTVSISLGGGGQTAGFPKVTADPVLRAVFVGNILDFCGRYGYDGADFDWEYPSNTAERDNYAALVRELRAAADARGGVFLISMAISPASWTSIANDYADLSDTVDWFFVMTYNYAGTWAPVAGHNAPLYARYDLGASLSVSRSIDYMTGTKGFPPSKLVLGLPFYGRRFNGSSLYGTATGGGALWYTDILKLIEGGGWTAHWDDISQAPWLTDQDGTTIVVYDDPASIAVKCAFARDRSLGGVGVWAMGYDAAGDGQPLVDAIGTVFGTVSVADAYGASRPSPIHLYQNRPNPFNPSTTIEFSLEREARVTLAVYNSAGQIMDVIENGSLGQGIHSVTWNAEGFPSGVYFCRLMSGSYAETKKMLLVK